MASGSNSDLYRWKRWTRDKPVVNPAPVTKKLSQKNDVQDWIKKVEIASDQAAAATFGLPQPRRRHDNYTLDGRSAAMATLDGLQDHNEAYTEAQDLLSQWMAEKINLDDDNNDDSDIFRDDYDALMTASPRQPHKSDLKNQWDNMLEDNSPGTVDPYNKVSSEELYHQIETRDDDMIVENILNGMLNKEVVHKTFKTDLGLESDVKKKKKDPRVTMDARQRKVKENRERREQEKEQKLRQRRDKKDTQTQARQAVLKEERQKAILKQREEALIQQEMAKIRKEMQDQRHTEEETKKRQQLLEETERERVRLEEEKRAEKEAQTRLLAERLLDEERQELVLRARQLKAVKAAEDLKTLQRHFQAWYQLVVRRRLRMGKARAVSDWRCLVRSWNAWRAYVRACQAEKDSHEAEIFVKEMHRRKQMSETHNRQRILRKYFVAWQNWIWSKQQQETLHDNQEKTRSKMAAFLDAAASGKLWTNRNEDSTEGSAAATTKKEKSTHRSGSDAKNVDTLFAHQAAAQRQDSSASIQSTARSNTSQESRSSRSQRSTAGAPSKPKHAWQVSRKHLYNLTAEEIATLGEEHMPNRNQNNAAAPSLTDRSDVSSGGDPSKKTINYRVNNFEHRYAAQQKLLHDQQEQLKEQQRLIADLQDNQKQALLRMELSNIKAGGVGQATTPRDHTEDGDGTSTSARSEPESSIASNTARSDGSQTTSTSNTTSRSGVSNKPPALKGMDERAAHRAKLKAEREERQRKKEEEQLAKIREEEERKKAEEEAEKKAKIERRRQEKRLVKQREEAKQQRLQQIAEQHARADEHYKHALMRHYGLKPWRKLIQISHHNMDVATGHHSNVLLRSCMLPWHQYTQDVKRGRMQVAEDQYQFILVRRCFSSWKKFGHYQSILLQKARRHHDITIKMKIFVAWQDFVTNERLERYNREELATQHNTRRIMKTAFHGLRCYPKMLKAEKEREKRREEMRKKVASLIPDFGGFS